MLSELSKISGALEMTYYAKGIVISHCSTANDLTNARKLLTQSAGRSNLPVIPLFESKEALVDSAKILKEWFGRRENIEHVRRYWSGKFEVMLGYSDSAKEIGVLSSRLMIARAMSEVESTLKSFRIQPIFFHGSGGSVARGGGSIKEQIHWWPNTAVAVPKLTVQGEMIQRMFATKEILNSQCVHLTVEAMRRKVRRVKFERHPVLEKFASIVEEHYQGLIGDPVLLGKLLAATPYKYLEVLRIGSRPSKRPEAKVSVSGLRAIPWVLCWTQTRSLLPTWWGTGSAWAKLSVEDKATLKSELQSNPFFSSFIKALGFTLAKVELDLWELYFPKDEGEKMLEPFKKEYGLCLKFMADLTGEKHLVWHRPWLEESIRLRAPNIHILNMLQVLAMAENDEKLLKETLVGIACGMLTTG